MLKRIDTSALDWNFFRVWLLVSAGPMLIYAIVGMLLGRGSVGSVFVLPILLLGALIAVVFGEWMLLNQRLQNPLRLWFVANIVGICLSIALIGYLPMPPLMNYIISAAMMGTAFWFALRPVLPDMAWMFPAWVIGYLPMALAPLISFYGALVVSVLLSTGLVGLVLVNAINKVPELEVPIGDMIA